MDENAGTTPASTPAAALAAITAASKGGLTAFDPTSQSGMQVPEPFAKPICLVEYSRIAGTTHVEGIDSIVAGLQVGAKLKFVRDSENLHDRWTIKVLTQSGERIGFVARDSNELLARLMDGGKRLYGEFLEWELAGNWHQIYMDIYMED